MCLIFLLRRYVLAQYMPVARVRSRSLWGPNANGPRRKAYMHLMQQLDFFDEAVMKAP